MADTNSAGPNGIAGLTGWRGLAVSFLAGAGVASGQAPYSLIWIAAPALCLVIFWAMTAQDARQSLWRGFFVGFSYALVAVNWIVEPFLVDIVRHGWMAPFALAFMAAGFGVFWGLAFWGAAKLSPGNAVLRAVSTVVALTATEMLRSYILTGFPWALISYIWIDTPVYQISAYVGPHGLTFLTLGFAAAIMIGIADRNARIIGAALAFGIVVFAVGTQLLRPTETTDADRPIVRLIQPNADQNQKWDPQMMPVFYNRQLVLTAEVAEETPDLVIWPEVAVPFLLNDPSSPFWEIAGAAGDAKVILGAQRLDGRLAYNSLAVLGPDGEITDIYDKHHLVPFGEYIPGGWLLNRLGMKAFTAKYGYGYSPGPGPSTLDLGELGRIMPLICYEGIFPHELRRTEVRPDWLLMITNDAWFGEMSGPYQHLAQARARTIETGLPMVRVANTGISAVINAGGIVVATIDRGVAGYVDVRLPAPKLPTTYWKTGDIPVVLLLIVFGLVLLNSRRANTD